MVSIFTKVRKKILRKMVTSSQTRIEIHDKAVESSQAVLIFCTYLITNNYFFKKILRDLKIPDTLTPESQPKTYLVRGIFEQCKLK